MPYRALIHTFLLIAIHYYLIYLVFYSIFLISFVKLLCVATLVKSVVSLFSIFGFCRISGASYSRFGSFYNLFGALSSLSRGFYSLSGLRIVCRGFV